MFIYSDMFKDNVKPYVIAEIGANHNGDMELAKRIIDEAVKCGADCVKFQSWSKESIFSKKTYNDNYFLKDDYRNRTDYTLEQIVDKYHLSIENHKELKRYCEKKGIDFNSTPFSNREVDLLIDELQVPFLKIASMDLNNIPFLKYAAKKKKPIVISTGLCGLTEINNAVECLEQEGCREIVLLHCVSIYPPKEEEVSLNNIDMLRKIYGYPVGYSDHTIGIVAPIMSIAKNVKIIEKHFTLDKNMVGWDHKISADFFELKAICDAANVGYKMLGNYRRNVYETTERREAFQRSIVAAKEIKKGDVIRIEDLDYKRPGSGISPQYYEFVIGKTAKRDIGYDEIIQLQDF